MANYHTVLDDEYWSNRYKNQHTGWDIGEASAPLAAYIDQLENKLLRILIPGCGNAYEAAYLWQHGFINVTLLDISATLVEHLKTAFVDTGIEIIHGDYFLHSGKYDLILEQTFFCALHPSLRSAYAQKASELLLPDGKLKGVLFDREFDEGPPFGGTVAEYENIFCDYFKNVSINTCYNSIAPRRNAEVWISMIR